MANHTIFITCPNCGHEYDARLYWQECPNCGNQNDIDEMTLRQLYF